MPNKGLGELERLTRGERLLIARRSRGEGQKTAALRHGVKFSMYGKWERDTVKGPSVRVGPLKAHERCLLYRRRSGKYQFEVAADLGFCRFWVNKMERGDAPCDDLLWYWEH